MTLEELAVLEQTGSLPRREDGIYGLTSQDLLQQSHWEAIRREQAKNVAKYITLPEAALGLLFGGLKGGSNPRPASAPQRSYTHYDTLKYLAAEQARGALSTQKPTYKSPVRTALDKARETVRQKYAFAKDNPLEKVIESVKPSPSQANGERLTQQDMFLPEQVRLPFGKLSPEAMAERMRREPQLPKPPSVLQELKQEGRFGGELTETFLADLARKDREFTEKTFPNLAKVLKPDALYDITRIDSYAQRLEDLLRVNPKEALDELHSHGNEVEGYDKGMILNKEGKALYNRHKMKLL